MPPVCPPELARLAAACWNPDSTKRPSAKEIADALEAWVANATKPPPAPQPDHQSDVRFAQRLTSCLKYAESTCLC
jgi:hypothetical protein